MAKIDTDRTEYPQWPLAAQSFLDAL